MGFKRRPDMAPPGWPHDPPGGFPGLLGGALAILRRGGYFHRRHNTRIIALIADDMPSDLKALLHTFALKRVSNCLGLGAWEVAARCLRPGVGWSRYGGLGDVDLARLLQVGGTPDGNPLLATWAPGTEHMHLLELNYEFASLEELGSLPAVIHAAVDRLAEAGEPLTEDLEELLGDG